MADSFVATPYLTIGHNGISDRNPVMRPPAIKRFVAVVVLSSLCQRVVCARSISFPRLLNQDQTNCWIVSRRQLFVKGIVLLSMLLLWWDRTSYQHRNADKLAYVLSSSQTTRRSPAKKLQKNSGSLPDEAKVKTERHRIGLLITPNKNAVHCQARLLPIMKPPPLEVARAFFN